MDSAEDIEQRERQLNRFKKLISDLMRGELNRNSFEPWEIALLLDFDTCQLPSRRRQDIMRQYLKAVERQLDNGEGPPMMLSQFLELREQRRNAMTTQILR